MTRREPMPRDACPGCSCPRITGQGTVVRGVHGRAPVKPDASRLRATQADGGPPEMPVHADDDACAHAIDSHLRAASENPNSDSSVGFYPLSCSPFQAAGTYIPCLSSKLFSAAATGQGRRHDHETTGDHALMRGLVTAGPVMRRGASSV